MLAQLLDGLAQLLAPSCCPGCELPLAASAGSHTAFCDACHPLLEPAPAALLPPQPTAAAFLFQGPLADAIRRLKYAGRSDFASSLGRLLSEAALPYAGSVDLVVPVPLHPSKLHERGYNPAALLARPLASELGVALDCRMLRRTRATRVQAGLARAARADNVRGAFAVATPCTPPRRILLIDDVRTTGATLSEAARALSEAGHSVRALALAWAPA